MLFVDVLLHEPGKLVVHREEYHSHCSRLSLTPTASFLECLTALRCSSANAQSYAAYRASFEWSHERTSCTRRAPICPKRSRTSGCCNKYSTFAANSRSSLGVA